MSPTERSLAYRQPMTRPTGTRPRPQSVTPRSLAHLRRQGYLVAKVEHWNHFARKRQDVFGFDLLAIWSMPPGGRIVGVQVTTASNVASRVKKLRALPTTDPWLHAGGSIVVHGWSLRGRGRKVWTLRDVWL